LAAAWLRPKAAAGYMGLRGDDFYEEFFSR